MAFNKLESSNNQEIISEEVGILKELLDDATRGMAGEQGLTTIQHLVELYDEGDYVALTQAISEMTNDDMVVASRYFSLLPLLLISLKTWIWLMKSTTRTILMNLI